MSENPKNSLTLLDQDVVVARRPPRASAGRAALDRAIGRDMRRSEVLALPEGARQEDPAREDDLAWAAE